MDATLIKYLSSLDEDIAKDKSDLIMTFGLLLEKNNGKENPTDYTYLLPTDLINLKLSKSDSDEIVSALLDLLEKFTKYSDRIVWAIGKTYNEKNIESVLSAILKIQYCDDKTFKQVSFLIDVFANDKILDLFCKIKELQTV